MRNRFLTTALTILTLNLAAQWQPLPLTLKRLSQAPGSVQTTIHHYSPFSLIKTIPSPHAHHPLTILKNKKGIFAAVVGTGYIYKLDILGDSCRWIRLDSTYYSGYNLGAFTFCTDSLLFSLGGSGLFNLTGHLRFYNEQNHEWGIIPLNREVLLESEAQLNNTWFNPANQHVYTIARTKKIAALRETDPRVTRDAGKLFELDPISGTWRELGTANDTAYQVAGNSPWGLLANNNTDFTLIDYSNNHYYAATATTNRKLFSFLTARMRNLSFFIDSTFYYGDFDQYIDSIPLSLNDFKPTGEPVYQTTETSFLPINNAWLSGIGFFLVSGIFLTIMLMKKRNSAMPPAQATTTPEYIEKEQPRVEKAENGLRPILFRNRKDYTLLAETEKSLLKTLLTSTLNGETSKIEQINKVLGVASKNTDVQKRMRSDMINSINQKMALILEDPRPVIVKQRSEFDKRSFEYSIDQERLQQIQDALKEPD